MSTNSSQPGQFVVPHITTKEELQEWLKNITEVDLDALYSHPVTPEQQTQIDRLTQHVQEEISEELRPLYIEEIVNILQQLSAIEVGQIRDILKRRMRK